MASEISARSSSTSFSETVPPSSTVFFPIVWNSAGSSAGSYSVNTFSRPFIWSSGMSLTTASFKTPLMPSS